MIDLSSNADAVLFANADWAIRGDGLEHRWTGYFIAREALAARRHDHLWEWPLHLSEKSWCAPRPFREAFLAALEAFGIEPDGCLARSFALGFGMRTGAAGATQTGFVSLGELVRPKPVDRKRPGPGESRPAARRRMAARGPAAVGARA